MTSNVVDAAWYTFVSPNNLWYIYVDLFLELPVHIIVPLQPEVVTAEGETLLLSAEVSKPNVHGTWFRDDIEILPEVDKKYTVGVSETIHTLQIHDINIVDQGEYTLEIGEESTTSVLKVKGQISYLVLVLLDCSCFCRSTKR